MVSQSIEVHVGKSGRADNSAADLLVRENSFSIKFP